MRAISDFQYITLLYFHVIILSANPTSKTVSLITTNAKLYYKKRDLNFSPPHSNKVSWIVNMHGFRLLLTVKSKKFCLIRST